MVNNQKKSECLATSRSGVIGASPSLAMRKKRDKLFLDAVRAVEPTLRDFTALARLRIEDVAAVFARVWRCVQVQADSKFTVAGVGDAMESNFVAHVGHLVLFVRGISLNVQRGRLEVL